MKYRVNKIDQGEDELILNYKQLNSEVDTILSFMNNRCRKIQGKTDDSTIMLSPDEILYIEKVDEKTFAYTDKPVIQLDLSLSNLELFLNDIKFFRCSKSMIVNIEKVERLNFENVYEENNKMKKNETKPNRWERYLVKEIGIEFKACLYFFAILLYYCIYQLCNGIFVANILHMAEMIFLTYLIGYLQVYVFWNFDESDHLRGKEIVGIIICTAIYTGISFLGNWFHHQLWITIGFAAYVIFLYICVFCVYKIRRSIDEKLLNSDLDLFKTRTKN